MIPPTSADLASRSTLRRRQLLLGLAWLAAWPCISRAQDAATLEKRVKAAFLYKFVAYISWPEGTFAQVDSPIVIAVVGDDALAAELGEAAAGRPVDGRPVVVVRQRDATGAHLVFVASPDSSRVATVVRGVSTPTVVVSEAEGALAHGSMINFLVNAGRVKFEIAVDTAERRGIKFSSRLLSVAQTVRTGNPS